MSGTSVVFLLVLTLLVLAPSAHAFGAGEIPDYAYLADKAFRHGDLENTLLQLNKIIGGHHGHGLSFGSGAAGFLTGIAGALKSASGGGTKFSSMDVKRVYFGNWACDYSQALDIAGLTKLTPDSLLTIVMALGFMTFGFATGEFKMTTERLGCYLCTTHIDNPKGYGDGQDPRDVYPGLRPPVDPEELELNDRNGMKNYIATEGREYDTSTALLKRVFRACIEHGRRAGGRDGDELWEAFRLLGQGLHTCEDLLAHSNWCELALHKLGHQEVFCHVGDNVTVRSPHGPVPPLVTGTFGSADFLFSLLGEATDHLSEASLTDLSKRLDSAKNTDQSDSPLSKLSGLFKMLPIGGGDKEDKMQQGEEMKAKAFDLTGKIDEVAPEEVQKQLWEILEWRDGIMKDIAETIENIPGLEQLLDQITEALNVYVFTILEPFMTPILHDATGTLQQGSSAVIESNHENQYEVWENSDASDPSHSLLSKDHFALILNEPAGLVATVVVKHVVNHIVQAWYDESNIDQVIEQILEVFHHPYYASGRSQVQNDMAEELARWFNSMSEEDQQIVLQNLTKESVREGKNKRAGHEDDDTSGCGHGGAPAPGYNAGLGRATYGQGPGYGAEPRDGSGGSVPRPDFVDTERLQGLRQQASSKYNQPHHAKPDWNQAPAETETYGEERQQYRSTREEGGERYYGGQEQSGRGEYNQYGGGGRRGEEYSQQERGYVTGREENPYETARSGYGGGGQRDEYSNPRTEYGGGEYGGNREQYGQERREFEQPPEEHHHKKHHHHQQEEENSYADRPNEDTWGAGRREAERGEQESGGYGGAGYSDPRARGEESYARGGGGGWNTQETEGYGQRTEPQREYGESRQEYGGGGGSRDYYEQQQQPQYQNESRRQWGGGGGEDETFGAERLNLGGGEEEDQQNEYGERRQHRQRDYYE